MNKAARAKALARGGQVLLADLGVASEPSAAESQGSGWMLSWRGSSPSWATRTKSRDSALHLPPVMAVDTAAGTATASLQALDGVNMRGFSEKVNIAQLVVELPGEGPTARGVDAGLGEDAGGSTVSGRSSVAPRRRGARVAPRDI
jgi:hypothetical protein